MYQTIKFKNFAEILKSDNFVFHIHTNLTDGENSLKDYHTNFKELKLIFTEHIRKDVRYDWKDYLLKAREYGFLAGFEAKVLPGGFLNIEEEPLNNADVIAVAVHSYPRDDCENLISSIRKIFEKYCELLPTVWVHPYTSSIERQSFNDKIFYIHSVMKGYEDKVYIEYNLKRKNFSIDEVNELKKNYNLITGYDAHSVYDIIKFGGKV